MLPCLPDLYRLMDYGYIFDSFGHSLIWYSCKMSSSIIEERNRRRLNEVYSGILYRALPSACLKACILQIFLGASQALCALLLLLLPPLLEWSLPPKLYGKITRIVCEQSGQNKDGVNGVGASAMGVALLWKTVLAEANAEHDVGQGWP